MGRRGSESENGCFGRRRRTDLTFPFFRNWQVNGGKGRERNFKVKEEGEKEEDDEEEEERGGLEGEGRGGGGMDQISRGCFHFLLVLLLFTSGEAGGS